MQNSELVKCDHPGRGYMSYPALVIDGERQSLRLRLCTPCYGRFVAEVRSQMSNANDVRELWAQHPFQCDWGGDCEEVSEHAILFVTTYPDGKAREDYRARLCEKHVANARQIGRMAL